MILDFRPRLKNHYRKVVSQRQRVPRPILFFVAAKENSSACSGRSSDDLPRPILISVATAETGPPAEFVSAKKTGSATLAATMLHALFS